MNGVPGHPFGLSVDTGTTKVFVPQVYGVVKSTFCKEFFSEMTAKRI